MMCPFTERIDEPPAEYLARLGHVFAIFGDNTQDSGNVSYGVQVGPERFFVKTAGDPENPRCALPGAQRVALLHNAVRLRASCDHPALPALHRVIESPQGPLLVYEWVSGELLRAAAAVRDDPRSAFRRFTALPVETIARALDTVYHLHEQLADAGWVAVDFYDGCLIYDFATHRLRVIDLDMYHPGPFTNTMGRMFGSSRFMAPEEFVRGATIDQRSNVFTLGRAAAVFLGQGIFARQDFRGGDALWEVVCCACDPTPDRRFATIREFRAAWQAARRAG